MQRHNAMLCMLHIRVAMKNRAAKHFLCRASNGWSPAQYQWVQSPAFSRYYSSHNEKDTANTRSSLNNPVARASAFLGQVQSDRFHKKMICQRVEEILLQLLAGPLTQNEGPLSLDLLDVAIANADIRFERVIPRLFSLTCQVILESGHPLALNEVIRQLWRLLDNHTSFLTNDLAYNSHHVNDACSQYINTAVLESNRTKQALSHERRSHIENLMKRLAELYNDPSVPLVADVDSCNSFIMFFCNQGRPKEAYQQLKWMVDSSANHPVEILPRVMSFTATIAAFAKTEPEMSLEILQWMLNLHRTGSANIPAPNTSCFNGLLNAWARSGKNDAGKKAEQTIEWMQQLCDTEGLDTAPDGVSYNTCINAWANSPVPHAASRAEFILRRMISMYENGSDITPSDICFSAAMNAWANSGAEDAPHRVSTLLDLHKSFAKESCSAPQRNSFPYSILLKAWENTKVNSNKRKADDCVDNILQVLRQMENDGIETTPPIHNSTIMALSKFSILSAILYFFEVEESYRKGARVIDVRTFNCGLSVMTSLNKPDMALRATDILNRMVEYSKTDPSVTPNLTTWNIILKILSRTPSPLAALRADELLLSMEGEKSIKTDQRSFVTVIIAWGRSGHESKFDRVQEIVKRYQRSAKAGAITNPSSANVYNAVLSVCNHNAENDKTKPKALETVLFALNELRESKLAKPDELTYSTFFQVINRLQNENLSEHHETLAREFNQCIKDGLVSRPILEEVHAGSPKLFEEFFGPEKTPKTVDIPRPWSKHLRS